MQLTEGNAKWALRSFRKLISAIKRGVWLQRFDIGLQKRASERIREGMSRHGKLKIESKKVQIRCRTLMCGSNRGNDGIDAHCRDFIAVIGREVGAEIFFLTHRISRFHYVI